MLSNLGDDLPNTKKDTFKSPRPSKKSRKMSFDIAEVDTEENDHCSTENASNQLVIYNPDTCDKGQEAIAVTGRIENDGLSFQSFIPPNSSNRVLPSIGAFTVQCATCFKWRLIPTKEKYEEIRANILQNHFVCEQAREWRSDISCEDPEDISQDGSRLWAIDKPNIAQPPPGWERLLRIRGEGSSKFADVIVFTPIEPGIYSADYDFLQTLLPHCYFLPSFLLGQRLFKIRKLASWYYVSPTGKKLRSMVEIQRYLVDSPEHIRQDVDLSQFSFQIPRPLQENYVRKRVPRVNNPSDGADLGVSRPLELEDVNPLSWAGPPSSRELYSGSTDSATPPAEAQFNRMPTETSTRPSKKKAIRTPIKKSSNPVADQPKIEAEDAQPSSNISSSNI
ncbi:methyl-CpG-binding domain-containing protein 2-like isoform X1 [Typha angustifolia]|uniref:methyl-CpG-binding domain-containing protein 2-like isoform X1 n=1 Tax=Typha angustifolia TaxID=59011 RepID=UPI003C2B34BA